MIVVCAVRPWQHGPRGVRRARSGGGMGHGAGGMTGVCVPPPCDAPCLLPRPASPTREWRLYGAIPPGLALPLWVVLQSFHMDDRHNHQQPPLLVAQAFPGCCRGCRGCVFARARKCMVFWPQARTEGLHALQ